MASTDVEEALPLALESCAPVWACGITSLAYARICARGDIRDGSVQPVGPGLRSASSLPGLILSVTRPRNAPVSGHQQEFQPEACKVDVQVAAVTRCLDCAKQRLMACWSQLARVNAASKVYRNVAKQDKDYRLRPQRWSQSPAPSTSLTETCLALSLSYPVQNWRPCCAGVCEPCNAGKHCKHRQA